LGLPQLLTPARKFSRKPEKYLRSYVEKPPADPSYYRYDGGMWLTGIGIIHSTLCGPDFAAEMP
jgi:hypothetical protein